MLGDRDHRRRQRDVHERPRPARALVAARGTDDRDRMCDPRENRPREVVYVGLVGGHAVSVVAGISLVQWY